MTVNPPTENESAPYENLLRTLVGCIRSQPLLFMIAMAVLIVSLVIVGGGMGSSDLRFVVGILAALAIVGILAYYLFEARKMMGPSASPSSSKSDTPPPTSPA